MSEVFSDPNPKSTPAMSDPIGRFLLGWSKLSAIGGIIILLLICFLSSASVLGRWLFEAPIKGDVEMVQIGCALAIASFLPYAQMKNAHVIVDFFTAHAPAKIRHYLDAFAALLLCLISLGLTWRSASGAISTYESGATSMILGWPEWWAHLTIAPGFALLSLTALYTAYKQLKVTNTPTSLSTGGILS